MTMVRTGMTTALRALEQAIEAPRKDSTASEAVSLGNWRWTVRQRMAAVRDVLSGEVGHPEDGWLAARGGRAFSERNTLLGRMQRARTPGAREPRCRAGPERAAPTGRRHLPAHAAAQRPVYDDVEIELGGSE